MAWCRQATSHYLSQCWPRSMSPYGVTRPQWVKECPQISHCAYVQLSGNIKSYHSIIILCMDTTHPGRIYYQKNNQTLQILKRVDSSNHIMIKTINPLRLNNSPTDNILVPCRISVTSASKHVFYIAGQYLIRTCWTFTIEVKQIKPSVPIGKVKLKYVLNSVCVIVQYLYVPLTHTYRC